MIKHTHAELLTMTPQRIATLYRETVAAVRKLPEDVQWQHGDTLRTLQAAYRVAKESR